MPLMRCFVLNLKLVVSAFGLFLFCAQPASAQTLKYKEIQLSVK